MYIERPSGNGWVLYSVRMTAVEGSAEVSSVCVGEAESIVLMQLGAGTFNTAGNGQVCGTQVGIQNNPLEPSQK